MATDVDGSVLELGCGTGRVSLALAGDGHEIWALDLSDDMLQQLRTKAEAAPAATRAKLHVVHADMAEFDLGRKFNLIVAPFRAFQALSDEAARKRCLSKVKGHLSARGRFVMHVFKPKHVFDESWVQPESFDWEVKDPRTGKTVRRYERRKRIDLEQQILYVDLVYRIEGSTEDIVEPLAVSYFFEEQMRAMLLDGGLRIEEEFGYFDRRPITYGPELIYLCSSP